MNQSLIKQELHRLLQNDEISNARTICDKLCESSPYDVDAWLISASIHARLGALSDVVNCCKNVIKLQPNHVLAHYNLGIAHQSMGDYISAEKSYQMTLRLNPEMRLAVVSLGNVIMNLGRDEEAIKLFNMILSEADHSDPTIKLKANINLSLALCVQKRFSEAEIVCKDALEINPNSVDALNNLGRVLKEQGDLKAAADAHRKAVDADPDSVIAYSNLLLDLNYLADIDAIEVYKEHCRWGKLHAEGFTETRYPKNDFDKKRLRIAYVSPDFRAHSVMLFITGLIESHNRENVEVFCYSNVKNPDAWTAHVSNITDHWREINKTTDDQLAAMIKQDKIDILVDLSGHTADNRLLAFAKKPAPIQVTWLGYPNTTGMAAVDYRLTDFLVDPPGVSDDLCTETLVRLPHGFLCFQPLKDSPPVNILPMSNSGNITFGSFNNSAKINDEVVKLWCRILCELPDSRLLLKSPQFSDPLLKKRYLDKFKQAGIDPQRIEIYGRIDSTIEHLSLYNKVDVALDTFPYNGTTTTCEALWMGVPVVVLEGNNHAGRVGVSLLSNIGLLEMIANTSDAYVRICTELASSSDYLSELRLSMRERLKKSPLLDAENFAKDMEQAYRDMWIKYCE